jgi:hypothetical protein
MGWSKTLASFDRHRDELVTAYQRAEEDIGLIRTARVIRLLIPTSPPTPKNGNDAAWKDLTTKVENEETVFL